MSHFRHWGAGYVSHAEDLERAEAKVDDIKDRLGLPTPTELTHGWRQGMAAALLCKVTYIAGSDEGIHS